MSDTNIESSAKRLRDRNSQVVPGPSSGKPTSKQTPVPLQKKIEKTKSISMNELNDECLQKLFEHLNFDTFCQMAYVCKRFKQIAEEVFSRKHKEFIIKGKCTNSMFRRVLSKFSHLITSIDASEAYFTDEIDTNAIMKYCPTIEKLFLNRATINCAVFKPLFVQIKELHLDGCKFVGEKQDLFTGCANLEYLYFDSDENSCRFVAQKYPKLSGLAFDPNFTSFSTFFELLPLNPQIIYLTILTMPHDIYISSVVEYTKNLERLQITPGMMSSTARMQTKKVFLQLAKLKKLKKLTLDAGQEIYANLVAPLTDAFVKGGVALDELDLTNFKIGSKEIKSITNLKTLEVLSLHEIGNVSNDDLLSLSKLPLLTNLILYFGNRSTTRMSVDTLTNMIKGATRMRSIALIGLRNLKIKQKEYETLLEAAQSRNVGTKLIIQIMGCENTTSFDVPQSVQKKNITHLEIVYDTESD